MEKFKQKVNNVKHGLKEFHTKKPHIEFFTALLTVPVLLTVIILNVNNLKGDNKKKDTTSDKNQTIVITQPISPNNTAEKEIIVTKEACEPGIGNISIENPEENEKISENPVNIDISYDADNFCNVIWSYRVNGGPWSSYDDRSISLNNLSNGNVKFELRVKSVVNSELEELTRNFEFISPNSSSPTPATSVTITPAATN